MRQQISALTGLRGIAALWVLAYHCFRLTSELELIYRIPLAAVAKAGYLGVDIFFVLSGFVIAYNYEHLKAAEYGSYLWKRIARIYPVHVAALVLFALALPWSGFSTDTSAIALFRTLTMTHAWEIPVPKVWNSPSWSISAEFAAYLCFPLVALVTRRISASFALALICALFVIFFALVSDGPYSGNTMAYGIHRIAFEFVAGVLVFRVYRERQVVINSVTVFALLAMIVGASILESISIGDAVAAGTPVIGCVIVYGFACANGFLDRCMKRIQYLGHISYALYLVHGTVLGVAYQLVPKSNALAVYTMLVVACVVSFWLAHLFYQYVEQSARRKLLSIQWRARRATSAASS